MVFVLSLLFIIIGVSIVILFHTDMLNITGMVTTVIALIFAIRSFKSLKQTVEPPTEQQLTEPMEKIIAPASQEETTPLPMEKTPQEELEMTFAPRPKKWLGWVVGSIAFIFLLIFLLSVNSQVSRVKEHVAGIDTTIAAMQVVDSALTDSVNSLRAGIDDVKTIANNAKSAAESAQSTADDALSKANNAQRTANQADNKAKKALNGLAAKADTANVAAIAKKVNQVADTTFAKANLLDSLTQTKTQIAALAKSDSTLNKRVDSLKTDLTQVRTVNVAQDSVIARTNTQVAKHDSAIAKTAAKTDSLEKELKKYQKDIEVLWKLHSDLFTDPQLKAKFDAATPEEKIKMIKEEKARVAKTLGLN